MALYVDTTPQSRQISPGGMFRACSIFTSDEVIPNSTKIHVDIALFLDTGEPTIPVLEPRWECEFPTSNGTTVEMSFVGLVSKYKNLQVRLTRQINTTYLVEFEFLAIADTGDYLFAHEWASDILLKESANGGSNNIYNNGSKNIFIRSSVIFDEIITAEALIPCTATKWNSDGEYGLTHTLYVDGTEVNGYIYNKDLRVVLFGGPNMYTSRYFAGIMKVSGANTSDPHYEATKLQYGLIGSTIETAEFFTPNVIDFDKLQNGKGLIEYAGTYTEGEFTIDSTYFEPGQQYVIFWVYKQFDTWYSRKSEVISQIIPGPVPIKPDITCSIIVDNNETHATCCVRNAAPCVNYEFKSVLDYSDYNTQLGTAGLPGTFFDYFVRCDIKYNTTNDYTTAKNISELNPTYVYNNTGGSTWTRGVQMMIPDSFAGGSLYLFFDWIFNINGNTDHCIFPMTIHVVDYDDADFTLFSPSSLPDGYCYEDGKQLALSIVEPSVDHVNLYYLTANGKILEDQSPLILPTTGGGNFGFTVDYTQLDENQEYCIKVVGYKDNTITGTCACETMEFNAVADCGGKFVTWEFDIPGWANVDMDFINITYLDAFGIIKQYIVNGSTSGNFQTPIKGWFRFEVVRTDGCHYTTSFDNGDGLIRKEVPFSFGKCQEEKVEFDLCDAVTEETETTPCTNFPQISIACSSLGVATPTWSGEGTTTSSVKQYSFDGSTWSTYTAPLASQKVFFRWTLTYNVGATGCGDKVVYSHADCTICEQA